MVAEHRHPWAATGYAVGQLLLAVPLSVLFALAWPALALVPLGVGVHAIRALVPGAVALARTNVVMAESLLGRPVPLAVPTAEAGLGPVRQVAAWVRHAPLWRLVAWILFALTGGLLMSIVGLAGLGAVALTVVVLVLVAADPGQHVALAIIGWPSAAVLGWLWWRYADDLVRLRCRLDGAILAPDPSAAMARRVEELTVTRAETVDHSASEIRRIERDLHDGAQARLVSLGMNLGLLEDLLETDPESARRLLAEARGTTGAALGDLRAVVRGIHPPLLADRGLVGAVEALALDMALPVSVTARLPGRPPAPVESAVYFAVAECLANVGKHAEAEHASVSLRSRPDALIVVVADDGRGGARPEHGTGLAGVMRRLAAFDGTMSVSSPVGGPTEITVEVPCVWSSPKTTPSSGTV